MKRRTFLAASASTALGACAPGTAITPSPSPTHSLRGLANDAVDQGDITLTVWDQEVRSGQHEQIEALNAAFQKQYPNITVRRLSQSFDDLRKQSILALGGDNVPDVIQVNNTRADMGQFIDDGHLLSLASYADVFGWRDRFPEAVLTRMRYSAETGAFGDGEVYGLPQTGSLVGFFYRQEVLDDLGAERPETWDELFTLLDAVRGAGMQPMMMGNLEKLAALHLLGPLQTAFIPSSEAVRLALGADGADWTSEGNLEALAQMARWGAEHYFGDTPNSTDYESAWQQFAQGKGAFLPAGSWLAADLHEEIGEPLRFMAPPVGVDGIRATSGGTGVPWGIPTKAANPDAAAAYLDFITSPTAMETIASHGGLPVLRAAELAPEISVHKDVFEAFNTVADDGGLLPYLDHATPEFAEVAGDALQKLIGGQLDPEGAAQILRAQYK